MSSKGFIWAPYKIAKQFSIESPLSFNEIDDLPFGFHGRKMIYILKFTNIKKQISRILKLGFFIKFFHNK